MQKKGFIFIEMRVIELLHYLYGSGHIALVISLFIQPGPWQLPLDFYIIEIIQQSLASLSASCNSWLHTTRALLLLLRYKALWDLPGAHTLTLGLPTQAHEATGGPAWYAAGLQNTYFISDSFCTL